MAAIPRPCKRHCGGLPGFFLLLGTAVALVGCRGAEPDRDPLARPATRRDQGAPSVTYRNLVLVVADTLASRHLSSYGYPRDSTPFLARLAAEGIQFQGYSASSWTRSSMATLLTGLYPQRHRTVDRNDALPADVPFLSELLAKAGFQTAAFVNNPNIGKAFGFERGYTHFTAYAGTAPPAFRIRKDVAKLIPDLRSRFFLYVHLLDPHEPYFPRHAWADDPPRREDFIRPDEIMQGLKPGSPENISRMRNQYDGEIREMDAAIKSMFADLRRNGLLQETLVVVTADHGEEFYEHEGLTHGSTLYGEVLEVPFILGNLKPPMQPRSSGEPFDQVDFLPTVLEALGLPDQPGGDGDSQWSAIANGEPLDVHDIFSHLDLDKKRFFAIQSGDLKLIMAGSGSGGQLFDLGRDPGELAPLPIASPAGAALRQRLRKVNRFLGDRSFQPAESKTDEETLRQLKALGYIQ